MTSQPAVDVSVVVVNWNSAVLLRECLASLPGASGTLSLETWVVDNASSEADGESLRELGSSANLILNQRNLGFATACNQAAAQARGRYFLLLNPDTKLAQDSLSALVAYADSVNDLAAVGPRLRNGDGTLQRSCWTGYPDAGMALADALYLWKMPRGLVARRYEVDTEGLKLPTDVDHVLGACMLIRRAAWEAVGPLDEGYFLFLEETDWCWRAKRAGWRIAYYPGAEVTHYGQHSVHQRPSSSLRAYYSSYCRFSRKRHAGRRGLYLLPLKATIGLGCVLRAGLWSARYGRSRTAEAHEHCRRMLSGYAAVLRELPAL